MSAVALKADKYNIVEYNVEAFSPIINIKPSQTIVKENYTYV